MLVVSLDKAKGYRLMVYTESAIDLRGPEYNGRHVCQVDGCELVSIDLVRMRFSIMDVDLGFCRAHALVAVAEAGLEWAAVIQAGEPYESS